MMKPYKIPTPRIWVTDQAPIFYAGRIIRIKPSVIFEEKSDNSRNEIKTTDIDQISYKEQLLKKRNDLLLEIANFSLIIEEQAFYNIAILEREIQSLENQLKYLEEHLRKRKY